MTSSLSAPLRASSASFAAHRWLAPIAALPALATPVLFAMASSTGDASWARPAFLASLLAIPLGLISASVGVLDLQAASREHRARPLAGPLVTLNVAALVLVVFNLVLHRRDALDAIRSSVGPGFDATACLILTGTAAVTTLVATALGMTAAQRHRGGAPERALRQVRTTAA